jgi:hypothetical protein
MVYRRMSGGARGDGSGPLATIAAMGKLVVMETTGKLGLLEMSRNVLIRHFL